MCNKEGENASYSIPEIPTNSYRNNGEELRMTTPPRPVIVSQAELQAVASTVEALCDAIDDIEAEIKTTSIVQASIQTKLDLFSKQIVTLCDLVNGPEGLVTKTAVLQNLLHQNEDKAKQAKKDRAHTISVVAAVISLLALVTGVFFQVPACKAIFAEPPHQEVKKN